MRFRFKTKKLELLYTEDKNAEKYPEEVVVAFFHVMSVIDSAKDIRDLYALKSLHFEKLKGKRKDEHSLRLNKQWRLTLTIENDDQGNYLWILNIEDYH